MSKDISRREFLENLGVGAAASAGLLLTKEHARAEGASALPSRTLGRTGAKVSILAFGCGSRFLMYKDEESAAAILNRAIDSGITYLDTAFAYGDGQIVREMVSCGAWKEVSNGSRQTTWILCTSTVWATLMISQKLRNQMER
jgi:predicted aldo/keto reductase-like oxidoreductase